MDLQKNKKLLKHGLFNIPKAPAAFSCLKKVFGLAYISYITKCSRITSKPNLIFFSEQFY
jgi:hypothetical protein